MPTVTIEVNPPVSVRVAAKGKLPFVFDESELFLERGLALDHPIRVFKLDGSGINTELFLGEFAPTFSMLAWDEYDVKREQVGYLAKRFPGAQERLNQFLPRYYSGEAKLEEVGDLIVLLSLTERWSLERIRPRRKRSIARFEVTRTGVTDVFHQELWEVQRVPAQNFSQQAGSEKGDYRALTRIFNEASDIVASNPNFLRFLIAVADLVKEVRPEIKKLVMTMHQVSIFAEHDSVGDNSPEGIHQDGADYIVSAFVVERDGIVGGESVVYGPDKKTEYVRYTLQPGQGLFQADKNTPLWHVVTPIHDDPSTPPTYGKRSIFGFDINILE